MNWVLASANPGKLREFQHALPDLPLATIEAYNIKELPEETGETYEANAIIKATYVCEQTGQPALADDSGLEVDALGGAPGVYSARFGNKDSDAERVQHLLTKMQESGNETREARFMCVLVVAFPDDTLITSRGLCYGKILETPRGEGGFGYDPVFLSDDLGKTFADASLEEKRTISHRGQALRGLREWLATDDGHTKTQKWRAVE
ncbi:MAG: RdgB/HAM1 family non-canonical purine NTP pyrophosphatase [Deinococcota bacterium]